VFGKQISHIDGDAESPISMLRFAFTGALGRLRRVTPDAWLIELELFSLPSRMRFF